MKKILFAFLFLSAYLVNAQNAFTLPQNTLLSSDFWKKNPDLNTVKEEIAKGNSPSEANRGNHDVVSIAINNNAALDVIIFLIEQEGNSVNKGTHDGRIYLHWAASRGNAELVKYLIEKGSDIYLTDDKGATPIAFAAAGGQTNVVVYDLLIKAGNDPKAKNNYGANFLLLGIASDKELKLTDYFISKGLSLKDTDDKGNTAFHYAARSGDINLLKALLKRKVKYNEKALVFASQGSRFSSNGIEIYKYLVEELKIKATATGDNGENVLHNIAKRPNQEEIITYFINKSVDVNQADKDGNTVLINASSGSNLATVKHIFPKVKNVNAANAKGVTALAKAIESGTLETVAFLLENGADINAVDNNGNNLAYYLIQSYRSFFREGQKDEFGDKLELLKKAGLNLATPQKDGNTLFHLAVAKNDLKLIKKIDNLGADINALNAEGMTALHKAALIARNDAVLKHLVEKGADKNLLTEFDETAYDLASENELLSGASIEFLK